MVKNPNNPVLILDVQKMQSWVTPAKLMYEGDKGYNQPFKLTENWGDYNVTAENLCFSAVKPDGQVIDITDEPERFSKNGSNWNFILPDELTQAVGQVKCFFYVKDDKTNIVASSTKFAYNVEAKFTATEQSNSYVSVLERLREVFEQYIENAKNEVNEMDSLSNEYRQKLQELLAKLQKQTDDWLTAKTAEIDADIKIRQDELDKLNAEYQAKYNELVTNWSNQMTAQQTQYEADKKARDDEYTSDKANRDTEYLNDKKYRDDTYTADKLARDTEYQADKEKRDSDFANEQNSRLDDWSKQKQAIQDEADKQKQDNQARADQQNTDIQTRADLQHKNIQDQADAQKAEYEADKKARDDEYSADKLARDTEYQNDKKKRDDEYASDKASRDSAFAQEQTDRSTAWSVQSKAIDDDYKAQLAQALKDIQDQRDAKIAQIDQEWTEKKTALQIDIDAFKSDLLAKVQDASDKVKKLIETDLPAMQAKADEVQAKVDKLSADFSNIDWDSYAKKAEVYTKTETYNKEETNNLLGSKADQSTVNTLNSLVETLSGTAETQIKVGVDANTLTTTGVYRIENPTTDLNYPTGNWGVLNVLNGVDTRIAQIYYPDSNNAPFYRHYLNGAKGWLPWVQLSTKAEIESVINTLNAKANKSEVITGIKVKTHEITTDDRYGLTDATEKEVTGTLDGNTLTIDLNDADLFYKIIGLETGTASFHDFSQLKEKVDGMDTTVNNALPKSGGTLDGLAQIKFADSGSWSGDKTPLGKRGGFRWDGQSDWAEIYADENGNDNLDLVIQLGDDNSNKLSIRNKSGAETAAVTVNGLFTGNINWNNILNKPDLTTKSDFNNLTASVNTMPTVKYNYDFSGINLSTFAETGIYNIPISGTVPVGIPDGVNQASGMTIRITKLEKGDGGSVLQELWDRSNNYYYRIQKTNSTAVYWCRASIALVAPAQ